MKNELDLVITKYKTIISGFINGDISANEFKSQYMDSFKNEKTNLPDEPHDDLNYLFSSADSFCNDPELFEDGDLNEEQLRTDSFRVFKNLDKYH